MCYARYYYFSTLIFPEFYLILSTRSF